MSDNILTEKQVGLS